MDTKLRLLNGMNIPLQKLMIFGTKNLSEAKLVRYFHLCYILKLYHMSLVHHIREAGNSNLLSFLPVCVLWQSDANKFTAQQGD